MNGEAYQVEGNIRQYAVPLLKHLRQGDLAVTAIKKSREEISIELTNHSSALHTILFTRPRALTWILSQDKESMIVTHRVFLDWWYTAFALLVSFIWPVLLITSLTSESIHWWSGPLLVSSGVLILAPAHLLMGASSGKRLNNTIEYLEKTAENRSVALTKSSKALVSHSNIYLILYVFYIFACIIIFITWHMEIWPAIIVLGCVLGIGTVALILAANKTSVLRLSAVLPGLWSAIAISSLLLLFAPWIMCDLTYPDGWLETLREACKLDPTDIRQPQLLIAVSQFRLLVITLFFIMAFVFAFAIITILNAIKLSARTTLKTASLSKLKEKNSILSDAVAGKIFLPIFRLTFGSILYVFGSLNILGTLVITVMFLSAIAGPELFTSLPATRWIEVSGRLLALVIAGTTESPIAMAWNRVLWIFASSSFLCIVGLSIVQLYRQRQLQKISLQTERIEHQELLKIVAELALLFRMKPPNICIRHCRHVNAWAFEFGWFHRTQYIEITSGATELGKVNLDFLKFLIAHELAHLKLRHVSGLNRLREFGRLAFVGDSYVFSLADSWGYENAADKYVCDKGAMAKYKVIGCLYLLEQQARLQTSPSTKPPSATPVSAISATRPAKQEHSIKDSLRAFINQYTIPFDYTYWHPSIQERIDSIKRLKSSSPDPDKEPALRRR